MSPLEPNPVIFAPALRTIAAHSRKNPDALISINVGLIWSDDDCHFSDWRYFPHIRLTSDNLPLALMRQCFDQRAQNEIQHQFAPGQLIEDWSRDLVGWVDLDRFKPGARQRLQLPPQLGRFYPPDSIDAEHTASGRVSWPCRLVGIDDQRLQFDCNHPLAGKNLTIKMKTLESGHDGIDHDTGMGFTSVLCNQGPGLQARQSNLETDFNGPDIFTRLDEEDDSNFFRPSLEPFWDASALSVVSSVYDALLAPGQDILDLMAGAHSPLQESNIVSAKVVGAGLNRIELEQNPVFTQRFVLNVNDRKALPFPSQRFDSVLIHAAIEYVTRPLELFDEIARVLRPGGHFIITFSTRFMAAKAIRLWRQAYPFERPAILLSWLRRTGRFHSFQCLSQHDLPVPATDQRYRKYCSSDPVFAVCAERA